MLILSMVCTMYNYIVSTLYNCIHCMILLYKRYDIIKKYNVQLHCTTAYTVWYYPKVYYCGNRLYVTFCSVDIDRCASLSKKTDR